MYICWSFAATGLTKTSASLNQLSYIFPEFPSLDSIIIINLLRTEERVTEFINLIEHKKSHDDEHVTDQGGMLTRPMRPNHQVQGCLHDHF